MRRFLPLVFAICLAASTIPLLAASDSYDPYAVGNKWEYNSTLFTIMSVGEWERSRSGNFELGGTETVEVDSEHERRPNGDVVYLLRVTQRLDDGKADTKDEESITETLDLIARDGSYTLASRNPDEYGGKWRKYDPPLNDWPADPAVGKAWKVGTIDEDNIRYTDHARIAGMETVDTPAGRFEDCLKMVITHTNMTGTLPLPDGGRYPIRSGKGIMTCWLAKGVGLVKMDDIEQIMCTMTKGQVEIPVTVTMRGTKELLPGYSVK